MDGEYQSSNISRQDKTRDGYKCKHGWRISELKYPKTRRDNKTVININGVVPSQNAKTKLQPELQII
jgi:hypothetical protein